MIASDIVKGKLLDVLETYSQTEIAISSITEAEMRYGLAKMQKATALLRSAESFFRAMRIEAFDSRAASSYGVLKAKWEGAGFSVGNHDGLIAGHALAFDAILVTRDSTLLRLKPFMKVQQDFSRLSLR